MKFRVEINHTLTYSLHLNVEEDSESPQTTEGEIEEWIATIQKFAELQNKLAKFYYSN